MSFSHPFSLLFSALLSLGIMPFAGDAAMDPGDNNEPNDSILSLIPQPAQMNLLPGRFEVGPQTSVVVEEESANPGFAREYLAQLVARAKKLLPSDSAPTANRIVMTTSGASDDLGDEGYELEVSETEVAICASKPAGFYYAAQTLRQMLPPEISDPNTTATLSEISIPCAKIKDKPRFQWRGFMIDCSRTFWPKEYLRRIIDDLAACKMNRFHLHLTDDQGWRVEIEKYPNLTVFGAKAAPRFEGERNGFYSKQDLRDLIQYAADRNVILVPEIDLPGHSRAMNASYPSLTCLGKELEIVPHCWGYFLPPENAICVGKETTYEFIENVIDEVCDLFPSPYFHIGGDEVPTGEWEQCPDCQKRMKDQGFTEPRQLQDYFIRRMKTLLEARGKAMVGWCEILHDKTLPSDVTVMAWKNNAEDAPAAIQRGCNVIMAANRQYYFGEWKTNAEVIYRSDPVLPGLTEKEEKQIIGANACVWTHQRRSEEKVDAMIFPDLFAFSEIVWSPKDLRDETDFARRLQRHLRQLDARGINYDKQEVFGVK